MKRSQRHKFKLQGHKVTRRTIIIIIIIINIFNVA